MDQRILVIDAHPVYIHKMEGFLKGLTFHDIALARSGAEGVALAEAQRPQLIILSGMLPDMASEKVCELIKHRSGAPVIVQIGLFTEERSIQRLKVSGADVILPRKEKDLMPLQKAIEGLLGLNV
jgi:DNA-binding response OmpR family regulator